MGGLVPQFRRTAIDRRTRVGGQDQVQDLAGAFQGADVGQGRAVQVAVQRSRQPDLVPYRTTYYDENWGFCLPDRQLQSMRDCDYEVVIDSTLKDGALTYGECLLPGSTEEEILISTHVCHPSLCNDNLSGVAAMTSLAESLQAERTRFSYRFLFLPVTIGAIAWLARNEASLARIRH